MSLCVLCGRDEDWHFLHRPRHVFAPERDPEPPAARPPGSMGEIGRAADALSAELLRAEELFSDHFEELSTSAPLGAFVPEDEWCEHEHAVLELRAGAFWVSGLPGMPGAIRLLHAPLRVRVVVARHIDDFYVWCCRAEEAREELGPAEVDLVAGDLRTWLVGEFEELS